MVKIKEIKKVPYGDHFLEVVVYENNEFPEPIICEAEYRPTKYKFKRFWKNFKRAVGGILISLAYPILKHYFKEN